MRLFFIRHAKPKIINNDFYGCHLSDEGISQTKELALSGKLQKPDLIFSSPYNRAKETAKVFSDVYNIKFQIKDFLKEWNLQSLNLLDPEYVIEEHKGWANQKIHVKGNESLDDVKKRVYHGTLEVVSTHNSAKAIYFVCHGTIIDMICSRINNRLAILEDIKNMKHLDHAEFEYKDKTLKLVKDILQ